MTFNLLSKLENDDSYIIFFVLGWSGKITGRALLIVLSGFVSIPGQIKQVNEK